jgi:exo-1,4-beta-D-glucosaminidase
MKHRYGEWDDLAQYVEEAQVQNYEDTRAQFEAFIDHWTNSPTPATGTVYWQMNKGWPTMLWDLYNNDYDQAGSYFGAKKANEPLHVLYALDNDTVAVDNLGGATQSGLSVTARVYDIDGRLLDEQTASNIALSSQGVVTGLITPKVPATTVPPTPARTYFVELLLAQHGTTVDRNVYWLSTQQDVVDWSKTLGRPRATMSQYANLKALLRLPTATVRVTAVSSAGMTTVTITNTSSTPTVGFFLRADVRRGTAGGAEQAGDNEVLPITWSDNDVTLWPGESQTLTATYDPSLLQGATPVVSIQGWNVPRFDVAAG